MRENARLAATGRGGPRPNAWHVFLSLGPQSKRGPRRKKRPLKAGLRPACRRLLAALIPLASDEDASLSGTRVAVFPFFPFFSLSFTARLKLVLFV